MTTILALTDSAQQTDMKYWDQNKKTHYYVLQPLTTHLANFLHNQGYASINHLHPPLFHIPGPLKLGS